MGPLLPAFDATTGCLPADPLFHDATVEEARRAFVEAFIGLRRRPVLYTAYVACMEEFGRILPGASYQQWLDGSFTTAELEPGDIDFVAFVPVAALRAASAAQRDTIRRLFRGAETPKGAPCHAFLVVNVPPGAPGELAMKLARAYFADLFGRQAEDKGGHPKGIVRLKVGG